jgi:hypothetical protein
MTRLSLVTLIVLIAPHLYASDEPPVGTTLTLSALSVSVSADGSDRESKRGVYAPPPGWYVRSHRVVVAHRVGRVTYAVSTVPAGWAWRSQERSMAAERSHMITELSAYKMMVGGRADVSQSAEASGLQANASSHHVLVVDVTARGPGLYLWRGESRAELTVLAELVYLGR